MRPSDVEIRAIFRGQLDWLARQRQRMDETTRYAELEKWLIRPSRNTVPANGMRNVKNGH